MSAFKKLWKLIFGRTTILLLMLLAQALVIFGGFVLINEILWVNWITGIVAVIFLLYLMNSKMDSDFKLMWIILILCLPILGVAFFIFTQFAPGSHTKFIRRRINELEEEQAEYRKQDQQIMDKIALENKAEIGIFKYLDRQAKFPTYDKASVKFFPLGEQKWEEMLKQLETAKEFIFMEYFIVERGIMVDPILDILYRKAQEGVEIRFMYDGTNTLSLLPRSFPQQLKEKGIECKVFSPMKPVLSTHQNNRDHRKICVIDGRCAFTGGVNLADEYINRRERFGHWKDTAIMVEGEAVNSFTLMFLQMWNLDAKEHEDYDKYMRHGLLPELGMRNGGYIVPYGDSPLDNLQTGENVYLDIINKSADYVHIMTPYLILDEEVMDALIYAAHRGVDVKIIIPHIPDKKYAYLLARSYYRDLIKEGVQVYEYTPGFVHAKIFTSDDVKAVVGTINLDFRSLYLHFECAAYMWKNPVVYDIEADFQDTLAKSQNVTMEDYMKMNVFGKLAATLLRFIAPLM
ncbi:MAG: cardiolipin synthase [Eubacterium sp.]|nr:cardiolipin synthase [Candidatus Colimonas fimequi]